MFFCAGKSGKIVAAVIWLVSIGILGCQTMKAPEPLFTVRVRHINDFRSFEDHAVHVNDEFFIADTDYWVKVERFVPDFAMKMESKDVFSRSDKPLNPALQLAVYLQEDLLYETWILYQNLIPHAIHEPGYYFQFVDYANPKQKS